MPPKTIVVSANSDWNIVNFRTGLIRALQEAGYRPVVIAPKDAAAEPRMQALGVERVPITIDRGGLNPFADLNLLRAYRRLLEKFRPAAFLGFTIKPNVYGCLAAGSLGIPAVPNVSGLGTAFMKRGPLQAIVTTLYRQAFRRAAMVFFQNGEDREIFLKRKLVHPQRSEVLPGSGVDLQRFQLQPMPEGALTFLFVGRILRDKGVLDFVEAARSLRAELPDARFQLLGPIDDGNRSAITASEVDSWARDAVVEYLGTAEDVRPYVAAATAVVLPSYREGLPRSLLEAAAIGRPLIATDVPGCRQVVEDGVNGYLCSIRDPRSLAAAMRRIANLPHEAQAQLGLAGRRLVQEQFSEERVTSGYAGT